MASSKNEQQILFGGSANVTVTNANMVWSDTVTLNVEDWVGALQVRADNLGSPAVGDTCLVYVAWSLGDVDGSAGNDFDTERNCEFLMYMNTAPSTGDDPAIKTQTLNLSGKLALRVGIKCPQAGTRNMAVRARLLTHRPQ
jgi:hypothetical protein